MIYGLIHKGSGLGNQLFRYIATRVRADKMGVPFSMIGVENFKGSSFMKPFMGIPNDIPYHLEMSAGKIIVDADISLWEEKKIIENGVDIRGYDPEFNFIQDNTVIDGEFQDSKYFIEYMGKLDNWFSVEKLEMPDNVCVIGFRGGEFYAVPELGLPKSYFDEAISVMRRIRPDMKFEVHTDDADLASKFFPDFKIIHDIGINWRSVRYARYAIIANSSFYIIPRLLNSGMTIAPRYWARRNTKVWATSQNYYKKFFYV